MNKVIEIIDLKISEYKLKFTSKPLCIGGMAMEYYGLRKTGDDIDLVISNYDFQMLSKTYPDNTKDIYGDLGVVIDVFKIWRSIALLDYDFLKHDAIEFDNVLMVSLDRLLLMRVCAMEVEKYKKDLELIKNYYYQTYRNREYLSNAEKHISSYEKTGGIVFGGHYDNRAK